MSEFRPFPARFSGGYCELCGEQFETGDSIGYDGNEELVHEDCYREMGGGSHSDEQPRVFYFGR
jgi:ribosome-binding protein aMBF1 (putative translation factor)